MSEINERMRNWRTDRIAEYAKLEAKKIAAREHWEENVTLFKLQVELKKVLDKIEKTEKPYRADIDALSQQQAGIKSGLVETWGDTEDKSFECDAGTATLRTSKSLHIRSKEKLVAFLELNKKLTDFISSFEITKLRKIKDAGMLGDEICTYDEKKSISISIKEAEQ